MDAKKLSKKIAVIGAKMYPGVKFTDLLIPTDEALAKVMQPPTNVAEMEDPKFETYSEEAEGPTKPVKMGDAHTQRQRIKNIIGHTGKVQPKTNIDNDDAPPMKWRD